MELVTDAPCGELELVHAFADGPMPTGVSVSHSGRVFVNFPKWGDDVRFTVGEIRDGRVVPFPDEKWNSPDGDADEHAFVSVQSIVVDPADRLWVLDTGSPMFQPPKVGGPKLVCVDLTTDSVVRTIVLPRETALETTYLNDVRFDLRRGEAGVAYITDSADQGENAIIVVDLASGESWRKLRDHPSTKAEQPPAFVPMVEGRPFVEQEEPDGARQPITMGADGIAISADGERLWYSRWPRGTGTACRPTPCWTGRCPTPRWALRSPTRATRAAPATGWRPTTPARSTPPPASRT